MRFVCRDDDGDWYYFPQTKEYKRLKGEEVRGKISGKYLPDPDFLLERRIALYPNAPLSKIKPTQATYELWNHWNAIQKIPH